MSTMSGNDDNIKKLWLGIKMIPAFRNRIYCLAEAAGGPRALWEADRKALTGIGLTEELARKAVEDRMALDLDKLYARLLGLGIDVVTDEDEAYPELLRQTPGHPRAMFAKGELRPYDAAVAIVGARRSTAQGKAMAHELAADLAKAGVCVVSGAARGIDTAAHWGALENGGSTLGVLGCGLDTVYPSENRALFSEITAHGALLSEYPPGTPPLSHHFPARNRIVAGMCQALIVVEAGERSGALITADFAADYGRDVFAAPGFSKSAVSKGSNRLIKEGAFLIENAADVLDVLGIEHRPGAKIDTLTDIEKQFLEIIGWEAKRLDELIHETGASAPAVSTLLLTLEISGFIKRDITGSYLRVR